jgi:hypothetical protein
VRINPTPIKQSSEAKRYTNSSPLRNSVKREKPKRLIFTSPLRNYSTKKPAPKPKSRTPSPQPESPKPVTPKSESPKVLPFSP